MKKRVFAMILALAMAFSLAACAAKPAEPSKDPAPANSDNGGSQGSTGAKPDNFPKDSVNMFVHAAAGGGSDAMARTIGSIMEGNMDVPVVVDNKTGGTGSVCWQSLISSKADGYTISTVASELTYIGALGYASIGPDDVDFLGLCQSWSGSLVVPADSEWETFADFVDYCKAHPGEVSVGDGGTGNIWQLAAYTMEKETGIEVNHVPFDGAAGEMTALLGGHCDAIVVGASEAKANIDSGAMKCLCVFNDKASSAVPDAPTAVDAGYPGLICNVWVGIGCPKGLPEDVKAYLVDQVKQAVESDTFKKYTEERGTDWNYMSPDELYALAKSCGCVQKGGGAQVVDVLDYGEAVTKKGLNLLSGPGNDLVSATALTAAGAHLILFTTGRGTPFGAPAPTVKISTNTALFEKKRAWIDFDAGAVARGESLDAARDRLLDFVLEVAGGRRTRAEERGFREISIFKDGVVL